MINTFGFSDNLRAVSSVSSIRFISYLNVKLFKEMKIFYLIFSITLGYSN